MPAVSILEILEDCPPEVAQANVADKAGCFQVSLSYEKAYFVAQSVNVSPFKLLLGSMFSAEVATSDHAGPPVTATFERTSDYLQKYDEGSFVKTLYPN